MTLFPISRLRYAAFALATASLAACTTLAASPPGPGMTAIQAYTDAFNARDVSAMSELMHPDIEWWAVTDNGAELISMGRKDLAGEMEDYFEGPAAVTSTLSGEATAGPYISTTETARWTDEDGTEQSQAAIVVYQVSKDGLIRRVWYYPAYAADAAP